MTVTEIATKTNPVTTHPIPTCTDIPLTQGRQRSLEVGSANALHAHYAATGGHADCYAADVPAPVSLAAFVHAFYTSPLFRLERWILAVVLGKTSTDAEAKAGQLGRRRSTGRGPMDATPLGSPPGRSRRGASASW